MLQNFRKVLSLLEPADIRRLYVLLGVTIMMSIIQAGSVVSILPLITIITNPDIIDKNGIMSFIYTNGGFENKNSFMLFIAIFVLLYFIFTQAFRAIHTYYMTSFTEARNLAMTNRLLQGYLNQPYVWFLHRHSADLGKSVLTEVRQVVTRALMPVVRLISNILIATGILAVVIAVDPTAALIGASFLGMAYGLIYLAIRNTLHETGREKFLAHKERFYVAQESMNGIKDIKLMGLERVYADRFNNASKRYANAHVRTAVLQVMPRYALESLAFGGMIGLVVMLLAQNPDGINDVLPVIGVYAFAAVRLFPAVQGIFGAMSTLRNADTVLSHIHADFEQLASTAVNDRSNVVPLPLKRRVELRGVEYAYPRSERTALRGINLEITANSTVGIVGGTGAGKTTVVDIILGLLTPDKGQLLVDGTAVDSTKLTQWQKSVGYVPQQIFLVDDSVAANIAFGLPKEKIDPQAIERAARIAELHDFVMNELPEGYDTLVGERGIRLSGGQRQRIGIARALYHDPDMLILDEATSALDNLTEKAVMDAVHNLGTRKTVVLIAHRLTTVKACDEIFMLEHGRVVSSGSYNSLMQSSEAFRAMANVA